MRVCESVKDGRSMKEKEEATSTDTAGLGSAEFVSLYVRLLLFVSIVEVK